MCMTPVVGSIILSLVKHCACVCCKCLSKRNSTRNVSSHMEHRKGLLCVARWHCKSISVVNDSLQNKHLKYEEIKNMFSTLHYVCALPISGQSCLSFFIKQAHFFNFGNVVQSHFWIVCLAVTKWSGEMSSSPWLLGPRSNTKRWHCGYSSSLKVGNVGIRWLLMSTHGIEVLTMVFFDWHETTRSIFLNFCLEFKCNMHCVLSCSINALVLKRKDTNIYH